MTTFNQTITTLALAITLTLTATAANAALFGFEVVEGSFDTANYQISVDSVNGGNSVAFTFSNVGQDASALTSLYWDFGSTNGLSDPSSWDEGTGVDYTDNSGSYISASPSNMPGGNNIGFSADFGMNPDRRGGSIHNGIGSSETLTVIFDLQNGADFNWVLTAMNDGSLRVGAHIQGLGAGGELSATGVTTSATPIPGAVWLLGSGLAGLIGIRRTRRS